MTKWIHMVARIDPALRRAVARAVKRHTSTVNARVDASLAPYLGVAQARERDGAPGSLAHDDRVSMTPRDLRRRLDALATTVRLIARSTTGLRRSLTADAQPLVDLEGAVDAAIRSRRSLQRSIQQEP
jgi:hypothetical protein